MPRFNDKIGRNARIDPNGRTNDETEKLALLGGTGSYVGASGSIGIRVLPNFRSQWVINLGAR